MQYCGGMPSRNRVKRWVPEQVYHLYNRGNNKQEIFLDEEDYTVFLNLLKRHLSSRQAADRYGRIYPNWYGDIELLAFCLMPNHYHILAYQTSDVAITKLMSSVTTSYSGYFNKKYNRIGRLFQDTFKASHIDEDSYWQHISRYIHLNPRDWRKWEWSSLSYYLGHKQAEWVRPTRVLECFEGDSYENFVSDYEGQKEILDELKHLLAN